MLLIIIFLLIFNKDFITFLNLLSFSFCIFLSSNKIKILVVSSLNSSYVIVFIPIAGSKITKVLFLLFFSKMTM